MRKMTLEDRPRSVGAPSVEIQPEPRSDKESRRYMRTSGLIGISGIGAAVASGGWMLAQAGKIDLSSTELVGGSIAVGVGFAMMNVAGAFHDAAQYRIGPKSNVIWNLVKFSESNLAGLFFASAFAFGVGATTYGVQEDKRADQTRLAGLPHLDPNTIVRQVTAQEEHCAGERSGKVVTLDHKGRQFVFQCP